MIDLNKCAIITHVKAFSKMLNNFSQCTSRARSLRTEPQSCFAYAINKTDFSWGRKGEWGKKRLTSKGEENSSVKDLEMLSLLLTFFFLSVCSSVRLCLQLVFSFAFTQSTHT